MTDHTKYHFNFIFSHTSMSGVLRKLREQAPYFNENGIQMVVFNREIEGLLGDIQYIKMQSKHKNKVSKMLYEIWIRAFKYKFILKFLEAKKIDWAIVRYGLSDLSIHSFVRKYKNKIIFEHHSKELNELSVNRHYGLYGFVQLYLEKLLPSRYSKNLKNVIGVTPDILEYQRDRFNFKPHFGVVFPNAIDHKIIIKASKKKLNNENFKIIFSAGRFSRWHGLDILINSLEKYEGARKITLTLVGEITDENKSQIAKFKNSSVEIVQTGLVAREELFSLYKLHHLGVDSLGLKRLGILDGSSLKSKEYIARSMPYICVSKDAGLRWAKNFMYYIENVENINFADIISWYETLNDLDYIENYQGALKNISWSVVIGKLVDDLSV